MWYFLAGEYSRGCKSSRDTRLFILEDIMPKTRFQSIVFALLMVVFMVVAMELWMEDYRGRQWKDPFTK